MVFPRTREKSCNCEFRSTPELLFWALSAFPSGTAPAAVNEVISLCSSQLCCRPASPWTKTGPAVAARRLHIPPVQLHAPPHACFQYACCTSPSAGTPVRSTGRAAADCVCPQRTAPLCLLLILHCTTGTVTHSYRHLTAPYEPLRINPNNASLQGQHFSGYFSTAIPCITSWWLHFCSAAANMHRKWQ
jgi:hypothetical protein